MSHWEMGIYDERPAMPYRCTSCRRIGLTAVRRPWCYGQEGDPHDPALMERVPESFGGRAVNLIIGYGGQR